MKFVPPKFLSHMTLSHVFCIHHIAINISRSQTQVKCRWCAARPAQLMLTFAQQSGQRDCIIQASCCARDNYCDFGHKSDLMFARACLCQHARSHAHIVCGLLSNFAAQEAHKTNSHPLPRSALRALPLRWSKRWKLCLMVSWENLANVCVCAIRSTPAAVADGRDECEAKMTTDPC